MAAFASVFGDKLTGKSGEVPTSEALKGKKGVAIYFSAHWCPPCRGFTPKLAEWYTKDLKAKGLEIVFVSSDRDEASFKEYYGEQPWLALPFEDRDKKAELSKKYKVSGIPSVVILGPEGETLTTDGRSSITNDPTGENIPWKPKTFKELFDDAKLVDKDGQTVKGSSLSGKVLALYFSAHWCPPCRGFTPKLAEWYKTDLKSKGLEVVFISSDKDDAAFDEYLSEQPWLALAFDQRKLKDDLSSSFGVEGIPTLIILDKDGSVINKDGRSAISGDPTGAEFPWHPKPVSNLRDGPGDINETTTIAIFCESSAKPDQLAIVESMTPVAKKYISEAKAKGEDPEINFLIVTEGGELAGRLRGMMGMPKGSESAPPTMMLVDVPDNGGYYQGPSGDVTTEKLTKFIDDWAAKKLERKQLS